MERGAIIDLSATVPSLLARFHHLGALVSAHPSTVCTHECWGCACHCKGLPSQRAASSSQVTARAIYTSHHRMARCSPLNDPLRHRSLPVPLQRNHVTASELATREREQSCVLYAVNAGTLPASVRVSAPQMPNSWPRAWWCLGSNGHRLPLLCDATIRV